MTSVLALLPCLLATATPQGPSSLSETAVLDIVPMQRVCGSQPTLMPPLWNSMLSRSEDNRLDLLRLEDSEEAPFDIDMVTDYLRSSFEELVDAERLGIRASGQSLILTGEPALVAGARERLREMTRVICRPLQVEVSFWRADSDPAGGAILTANDYDRHVASHELLWQRRSTTRGARPAAFDSSNWTRYVRDVDVEIAQESEIAVPEIATFFDGVQVVVTPHALVGTDETVVHTQFTWAEPAGPVGQLPNTFPESAALDQPLLYSLCGACSGRIDNGGALRITMRGDGQLGANCMMTIRVSSRVPAPDHTTVPNGAFPIGAFLSNALLDQVSPTNQGLNDEGFTDISLYFEERDTGYGKFDADELLDLAYSAMPTEAADEASLQILGDHLFISAPTEVRQHIDALLRGLQQRVLRNATVSQRLTIGSAEPAAVAHELVLPTLLGRTVTAMRRTETTLISSVNAEVAQKAKITEPVVGWLQTGAWLRARVTLHDNDAHLALLSQFSDSERSAARQLQPSGSVHLPTVATQRVAIDDSVVAGQPISHGDGPTVQRNGQRIRSEVVTTVKW